MQNSSVEDNYFRAPDSQNQEGGKNDNDTSKEENVFE